MPVIVDHNAPFFSKNTTNFSPYFADKYETKKNLNPRDIKEIKTNRNILNPIKPLVIVKTLYGKGVNPAKKSINNQAKIPLSFKRFSFNELTLDS